MSQGKGDYFTKPHIVFFTQYELDSILVVMDIVTKTEKGKKFTEDALGTSTARYYKFMDVKEKLEAIVDEINGERGVEE